MTDDVGSIDELLRRYRQLKREPDWLRSHARYLCSGDRVKEMRDACRSHKTFSAGRVERFLNEVLREDFCLATVLEGVADDIEELKPSGGLGGRRHGTSRNQRFPRNGHGDKDAAH